MADELEIKIRAIVDEAVANLKKTETAVAGVTKETENLNKKQGTLADGMKKSSEGLTKIKNAVMEWASALQIGVTVGNMLVDVTNKIAASLEKKAAALEKANAQQQAYKIALKAVADGHIAEGATLDQTVANYVAMTAAMGKLDEASRKYIAEAGLKIPASFKETAVQGEKMETVIKGAFSRSIEEGRRWASENKAAIDAYIAKMSEAQRETSKDFIAMTTAANQHAEAMKKLPASIEAILPAFKGTLTTMGEAEDAILGMAKATGSSIEQIREVVEAEYARKDATGVTAQAYDALIAAIDRLHEAQKNIPADIDVEIAARKRLQDEIDKHNVESTKKWEDKKKAEKDYAEDFVRTNEEQQVAWRTQTDRVEENMRRWTDATQGAGSAFGALSGDFTKINEEVKRFVEAGGDASQVMVGMQAIALSVAQATDEATASLYRHIEATKLLREEQMNVLDVAQGWRDYLANLKEGYDVGLTSLKGYVDGLAQFKAQLLTLFGSVTGEAKKGLEDMIALIDALMQTAGGREAFDASYKGAAQRAFEK